MNNLNYKELIEINGGNKEKGNLVFSKDTTLDWILNHNKDVVTTITGRH